MGVNLRELFPQHPVEPAWFMGKRIAVDGHNVAFRYLTSIRARDGDLLRDENGRAVGHLYGFLGLVRSLRSLGAEPIIIWDGPIHPRKQATVEERIRRRLEAALNAEEAEAAGDTEAHKKFLRATTYLDGAMIEDCSRLLDALGVVVTRAPHDGERFAAALCRADQADAVATEDYDALVAGAPEVLRKAGGPDAFRHRFSDLADHGLSVAQLRQVALLCGTDWHPGVRGFGVKTALKALQAYPDLGVLVAEAEAGKAESRFQRLVAASQLSVKEFRALEAFLAEEPAIAPLPTPRPDPATAVECAKEHGVSRERVLACFC